MEWHTFGGFTDSGNCMVTGDPRTIRMHAREPEPITLIEDPGGDYLGWIHADEDKPDPVMVLRDRIYEIQFPYGSKAEEDAGRGRTVRLRIEREAQ
jgi:hypothetical protein